MDSDNAKDSAHRTPGPGNLPRKGYRRRTSVATFCDSPRYLDHKIYGETASKLRLVFDALAETRGVYLFDEVDALAGDRTGQTMSARLGVY